VSAFVEAGLAQRGEDALQTRRFPERQTLHAPFEATRWQSLINGLWMHLVCPEQDAPFYWTVDREFPRLQSAIKAVEARLGTQNNTAFQNARAAVGLSQVRVHDLRHTLGQRLRDAGVPEEDRSLLLGHAIQGMAQHYAAATLERLLEGANTVLKTRDRTVVLRVVNG
jgi:integrase